jgi:hypothetical protein
VYPDGYDAGSTHPTYLQSFAGCHNGTLAEQRVPIITRDAFEDDSNSFPQFGHHRSGIPVSRYDIVLPALVASVV